MKFTKEIKVGAFVLAGIIILILGYNFLRGFHPLKGYNTYYVVYNDVNGVVKSTQVSINGLKVGQVEDVGMLSKGDPSHILVTIIMLDEIKLPKGTTAAISSQDLLGTKVIAIKPASFSENVMQNGDTLVSEVEESLTSSITKMVSPIKEKSEQVLVTLDKVLQSVNDMLDSTGTKRLSMGLTDLTYSMRNLRNITQRFDDLTREENEKLRSMLVNAESITRNLKNNNEAISKAIKNISHISDSIAASDLTATINNTKRVMNDFAIALEKMNRGEGSLGKLANDSSLYINLNSTSAELTSLLKDMQRYPGRYFSVSVFGGSKRADKAEKKREAESKKK